MDRKLLKLLLNLAWLSRLILVITALVIGWIGNFDGLMVRYS